MQDLPGSVITLILTAAGSVLAAIGTVATWVWRRFKKLEVSHVENRDLIVGLEGVVDELLAAFGICNTMKTNQGSECPMITHVKGIQERLKQKKIEWDQRRKAVSPEGC
jgi:hypothetical protein